MMEQPTDRNLYEYAVLRYVPHVERQEFVNIGLLMLCKRRRWLCGRVELDAGRLAAFDREVDLEVLRRQTAMFERTDLPAPTLPAEEKYRWLTAVKSASLQVSPSHPGLLRGDVNPEQEFERLFSLLVKT